MSNKDYAAKIAAIIAKADSTTSSEEAEVFMAKAHAMMVKHGLSMIDIGDTGADEVAVDTDVLQTPFSYAWMRRCVSALGRLYGCRVVYRKIGSKYIYDFTGRESARITLTLMVPFVQRQIMALGREAFNEGHYKARITAVNRIGSATVLRIDAMARKEKPAMEGTGHNALVPVDMVDAAYDAHYTGGVKMTKARTLTVDDVATEKAKRVSVRRQATGAGLKQIGS